MIALIVTLCAGAVCEMHQIAMPGASLMACQIFGPAEIAKNFPPRGDQRVAEWHCQMEI